MLADLTPEEFAALRTALADAQRAGEASPPGAISYSELAAAFHTTPQDIKLWELCALEKMRALLHV
jgi:hypothetical protein